MYPQPMQHLNSPEEYEALRGLPMAFVYKHSTRCPISAMAYQEVSALSEEHPDVPREELRAEILELVRTGLSPLASGHGQERVGEGVGDVHGAGRVD